MKRLSLIIAMLTTLALAPLAQAGFHMEPHVGFGVSNKWKQGSNDGKFNLTNTGIKLGYQSPGGFQVGGEIQIGTGKYSDIATSPKFANVGIGPYLGYQSMMGLRGYVGIFRNAQAVDDVFDSTFTGIGYKLGIGYRIIDWFAVNAEYITTSYDKYKDNTGDGDLNPKIQADAIMIVASFPFNFGGK